MSASEAVRAADRDAEVVERRQESGRLTHTVSMVDGAWEVAYFDGNDQVALVVVDPASGEVRESWTGHQVLWKMARGYEGAFGHKLNAPYVFLPLCVLFLVGLIDWRRPWRVATLDLLVLLGFGVSHYFFNRAEIGVSVPLQYPVLLYLLGRALWIGLRGRGEGFRPVWPATWLLIAALFLMGFRVGLNMADSGAIDVGYAGVVGADRIAHGEPLYDNFPGDVSQGDTYGPVNYLAYVPFEWIWPWQGSWDDLPAAHGAAVAFDLATFALLILLGLRIRPGPPGRKLAATFAFAWAAYPYTAFALESNSNDTLVAALLVAMLLALARPAARGVLAALATLTKLAPVVLAPMLATYRASPRKIAVFGLAFAATAFLLMLWPAIDPGLHTVYDRTVAYQSDRDSPFSIWGQLSSLEPLRIAILTATGLLAVAFAFVPKRKSLTQVAALGAALLIALQLTAQHWFYLYIVWFYPLFLVAGTDAELNEQELVTMRGWVEKVWRWWRRPATKAAAALTLVGVVSVIVVQLCGGSPDATTLTLLGLAIALTFGLLAPRQTGDVVARVTSFKFAGIEIGLEAVARAERVEPPGEEGDGFVVKREAEGYDEILDELREKLRFVRLITDLEETVEDPADYHVIASSLRVKHLLDDRELDFILDLVSERDLGLSKLSTTTREEFLDAAWVFAVRFGSMVWDRYVRSELGKEGWVIADFRQKRGHRPDFMAYRGGRWAVMAARVGGADHLWRYGSTAERLAKYSRNVPIEGRCVAIPGASNKRQATVVAEKEEKLTQEDRQLRHGVKVLKLQGSLLVNWQRAFEDNPCNQDALRPSGKCATE